MEGGGNVAIQGQQWRAGVTLQFKDSSGGRGKPTLQFKDDSGGALSRLWLFNQRFAFG